MTELMPQIRTAVRAIITHEEQILLLKNSADLYYSLPDGAQDSAETLHQALKSECLEEVGCEVEVKRQAVEILFSCRIENRQYKPLSASHPDKHQVDVAWVPLPQIDSLSFSPYYLKQVLSLSNTNVLPLYLGSFDDEQVTQKH